jgi:hypothetical protein
MAVSPNTFICGNVGANSITLTVTDNNNNVSNCTATVTVQDNVAPVAKCKDLTIQLDASGNASITASQVDDGSADACGIKSMAVLPNTFICGNVGANSVTLTVTDNNNNVSTCTATVTVEDNVAPVAKCKDLTIQLDASGNASITASQIDDGSADACGIKSMAVLPNTFTCGNVGTNSVTLTVTDNNNNVSTCTAVVTVQDNVAPVAKCKDLTIQLDASGNASITASQVDDGSADACGIKSMAVLPNTFICGNVGANSITLTVTDNNNNVSSCTATVTLEDNVAPVAKCKNAIIQIDITGSATVKVSDIDNGSNDVCGIASMKVVPDEFNCDNIGENNVILTVMDKNGNSSSCNATVIVEKNIVPDAQCRSITVELDSSGNAVVSAADFDNGSNDICGISSMTVSPNNFNCTNTGDNMVTLTVTDNNGNISTCTSTVVIKDNTPPKARCKDITVELDATGTVSITPSQIDNGSSDACGIKSMTVIPNSFNCAHTGNNSVILTVTDNNNNVSTCNAIVTVKDNILPVSRCRNIIVQLNASGNAGITASQIDNGSNDNCGIKSMTVEPHTFTCSNVGNNSVTLTITDNSGNTSNCVSTVMIQDKIVPIVKCKNTTVQLDDNANATIHASEIDDGSTDACGIKSMTVFPNNFNCSNIGANSVTLTVTDNNNNVSIKSATVNINDGTQPIAECRNITVQLDETGYVSITASEVDNGSRDSCGIKEMSVFPNTFSCTETGDNS